MMQENEGATLVLRQIGVKSNSLTCANSHSYRDSEESLSLSATWFGGRSVRRYRNAALGYAWTVLEPALLASVYWFLFIMLSGNPDQMYAVWVLLGVIVWGCFSKVFERRHQFPDGKCTNHASCVFPTINFPGLRRRCQHGGHADELLWSLFPSSTSMIYPSPFHLLWVPHWGLYGRVYGARFRHDDGPPELCPARCSTPHTVHYSGRIFRFTGHVDGRNGDGTRGAWGEAAALWNPMVSPDHHGSGTVWKGKMVELPPSRHTLEHHVVGTWRSYV